MIIRYLHAKRNTPEERISSFRERAPAEHDKEVLFICARRKQLLASWEKRLQDV